MPKNDPTLTVQDWHAWFAVQAGWTQPLRSWLYQQVGGGRWATALEVGCGTGVVTAELVGLGAERVVGLDVDAAMLAFARREAAVEWVQGDAHALPFADGAFELVVCHYLLLWLADPAQALREMARVTAEGGAVLACAEPDYGGRIDHPAGLVELGRQQAEALRRQGADPNVGRRLGELFTAAGLQTTVGVMGGQWNLPAAPGDDWEAEWSMRERDLRGRVAPQTLARLREEERQAMLDGRRVLYVPTFYALGQKTRASRSTG